MKVTLITGASSGIGEEFARRLAAEGHNLVLVARSEKVLHELCDELMLKHKIMAHYIVADLIEHEAEAMVFEETEKHGFEVDWLINNAGFGAYGDFANVALEKQTGMIELNIRALIALTYRYLPAMRERRRGTIINVSSAGKGDKIVRDLILGGDRGGESRVRCADLGFVPRLYEDEFL